jgi:hypothetical protein
MKRKFSVRRKLMVACAIVSLGVGVGWQVAAAATGGSTGTLSQASSSAAVVADSAHGPVQNWNNGGGNNGGGNNGGGNNQGCTKPKNEGPSGCWPAGISTSSSSCHSGNSLTVTGNNFVPNEQITLTLETSPPVTYTVESNNQGSFTTSITVSSVKKGEYVLKATDAAGDSASTEIDIT